MFPLETLHPGDPSGKVILVSFFNCLAIKNKVLCNGIVNKYLLLKQLNSRMSWVHTQKKRDAYFCACNPHSYDGIVR